MSEKKELQEEELEKVYGGQEETGCLTRNVVVKYKDEPDGMILYEDLGRFEKSIAEANGENMAKEWCATNNKIYEGYLLGNLVTNNYNTKILLDKLSRG